MYLQSPPRCHQCSRASPAAQQRCCTSSTQLLPLERGPTAGQAVTERAEAEPERGHWTGPLGESAPGGVQVRVVSPAKVIFV